ncbi:Coenzyme F420 hydrogenase/dehydrogenase, beta subunit C-terminal domain [Mangrovicoccus sp. HB161399]|uniref:Coenzyme F420 hydrogenase/dehydrogenase, beta subunit C-terminal domain n=1 Tax=Mangrovicoccus sp. HB161399 TaxID=2720392 RepID=UPI0020A63FED|nr:Coenzyme F420 hydrogenase/dehydrogenase, beta subunit C-terminal domain [Mangrovicoccus sp. HB161399]
MELQPPGYLRPVQSGPLDAAEEARIARICPGLGQRVNPAGRRNDVLWGPWIAAETGNSTDPELRYRGSSGGGLSQAAAYLLEAGEVDAVICIAAAEDPVANRPVLATNRAEVLEAAGSRYAPSSPLADLEAHLQGGRRLAFIGKPCDVAALRALAAEDPRISRQIPWMLSFFCAGVPSHSGAEAVLAALGTSLGETVSFRYRGQGWPGRATATLRDGSTRDMSYHDSWGEILSRHIQHRCKICADGTGTAADLVCADAWETDDRGYPLFEEQDGTSLFLVRTAAGGALLERLRAAGKVETAPFDMSRLRAIQPGQRNRRHALLARLWGLRAIGRPVPDYRGLQIGAAARQGGSAVFARNFLGMVRRGLRRRD